MSGYEVKILADSLAPCGRRLTTFSLRYPRFVHAELMTHRLFSRNSASSRAIPAKKLREQVLTDPAVPVLWGANQKGMQADEQVADPQAAQEWWLRARDLMAQLHEEGEQLGIHKQLVNRIIEPWMWITVICSSTEYDNWFKLRDHPAAQPEIAHLARLMRPLYENNQPHQLDAGQWHLPLIDGHEAMEIITSHPDLDSAALALCKVSTGRCARVSYLTHEGKRDWREDIALCDRLRTSGHWSPFEHVAQALDEPRRFGNFTGFKQFRKEFNDEHSPQIEPFDGVLLLYPDVSQV